MYVSFLRLEIFTIITFTTVITTVRISIIVTTTVTMVNMVTVILIVELVSLPLTSLYICHTVITDCKIVKTMSAGWPPLAITFHHNLSPVLDLKYADRQA